MKSLQEVVNKHFKLYYEQLEKREYELVLECEEAPLEETIEDMLEKLVTEYDYLRNMFELSAQEPMTESKTRDFISKCD